MKTSSEILALPTHLRSLDGVWEFAFAGKVDPEDVARQIAQRPDTLQWEKVLVPSVFDASLRYAGKRGVGVYRRDFSVSAGHAVRLHFGAVSMRASVYVDGVLLAQNACGYAPFDVDVPPSEHSCRTLTVIADNRFDFEHVPMHEHYFDFYQYGGIMRSVSVREIDASGVCIDAVRITPDKTRYREGYVSVEIDLCGEQAGAMQLAYGFDGAAPELADAVIKENAVSRAPYAVTTFGAEFKVAQPHLWSVDAPHLHVLAVELRAADSEVLERRSVRFGLRRIDAAAGKLWLNGEQLTLKGYNRHEWHPNYGPCTPSAQMFADIRMLKDMGCNFVRGSHYHQDQRFLDLCDELGLLVWEENLGWGQRANTFKSEKFAQDHQRSLLAMVRESFNHPSVIIWGFLNEAASNEAYAQTLFERSVQTLRALDPSRLVSYASMFPDDDLYFGLVDLISVNTYPGWYGCNDVDDPIGLIAPRIDAIVRSIDARGLSDKPILISEIGAEGLYGWRDPHNDFFTETYQANYLKEAIGAVLGHPRCCGVALWHFSDVRTYSGSRAMARPRTFNNKGTLDEYRRPKEAYRVVQAAFAAAAQ